MQNNKDDNKSKGLSIRDVAFGGVIAAAYIVLTLINPLSFGAIQLRFSEILMLFCFYNPSFSVPLIIGCFVSNLIASPFPLDIIFGTMGTVLACVIIPKCKNLLLSSFVPVVTNALFVGACITFFTTEVGGSFFLNALTVAVGECIVVSLIGVPLFKLVLERNKGFMQILGGHSRLN